MSEPEISSPDTRAADEQAVRALYRRLLDGWNARDSEAMAAPFAEDAEVIGFDGSQMVGRAEIAATMAAVFADHLTAEYVALVRGVRFLALDAAILRADAGLLPRGQSDLNPALNARQTVVAVRRDGVWRIALFQNTPAQLHGRPDLAARLAEELRAELARRVDRADRVDAAEDAEPAGDA
ncbi:MAG TPA: SgcJ/EcaC family oxidoreductase [Ktedonobacterales bacterium]|nr:SgcJ/EcaC family oxidoreductase [Ktedonobacterales bacterium]